MTLIQIQDLHKSYDSLDVLKGVGLLAYEGSVVSLIGASGSGKSTLLRCANLLENSQSGDILFCGDAVRWTGTGTSRRPADKQQVQQMRSQLRWCFNNLTCGRI